MSTRRSVSLPIILGIIMIVLLVVLTVGWVLVTTIGALTDSRSATLYWAILSVGTTLLGLVVVGVIIYLALSIKAINLTRRQSSFIDSVTHELKSPIASLKLYLQTLNRRKVDPSRQASFFRFMLEDVERLDHLINHVLDAGRIDKGHGDNAIELVEMPAVLDQCAETVCLRYRVPAETVRLNVSPCTVQAPRTDLELIFRNLIDNAVKYAGADPQVEVCSASPARDRVMIRVADNGRGIPRHLRRRIFGRFERLDVEVDRASPGTGLGLHIVRTLVRRLHGRIRVRDRDGGSGTVFEVELPGQAGAARNVAPSHVPPADVDGQTP